MVIACWVFLYLGKTTTELGEFCGHVCLKASAAEKRERRRSSSRADEKTEMENFETEIRKILPQSFDQQNFISNNNVGVKNILDSHY